MTNTAATITKKEEFQLSSVFFAPGREVFKVLKSLYEKDRDCSDHYTTDVDDRTSPAKIAGVIVQQYYVEYAAANQDWKGQLNMQLLIQKIEQYQTAFKQLSFFKHPEFYFNYSDRETILNKIKQVECTSDDESFFAIGRLNEAIEDSDPDPYVTAGGYRTWKAEADTVCRFYLNSDNQITMRYESSCVVKHYNNNFFGNSTGGGTTKYQPGERVETRSKSFKGMRFDEVLKSGVARVIKADFAKAERFCQKNIDEI